MANPPRNKKKRGQTAETVTLGVVILGQEVEVRAPPSSPLYGVMAQALADTGNSGRPLEDWEARDVNGKELDTDATLEALDLRPGERVWVQARGAGTLEAPPPAPSSAPAAPHAHTRECYEDPGPGHGSPFRICGKWTPAELADLRATSPEAAAPLELVGDCMTCPAKGVTLNVQRQCSGCIAQGMPAEVLACTGCARVAHAYCGGKEGDAHKGCSAGGTWKRWPLVDGKPAQPVPLRRALVVVGGALLGVEDLARDAVLYARLYPPTAGGTTPEALRIVSRDAARLFRIVESIASQPAVAELRLASLEDAAPADGAEEPKGSSLPDAAREWLAVQARVDAERAELEKASGEPAPLGAINYWGYVVEHGGKTFDGRPMVRWSELTAEQQDSWECGALAVLREASEEDLEWARRGDEDEEAEGAGAPDNRHELLRGVLDELEEGLAWLGRLFGHALDFAGDDERAGALGMADDLRQLLEESTQNHSLLRAMQMAWRAAASQPVELLRAMRESTGGPPLLVAREGPPAGKPAKPEDEAPRAPRTALLLAYHTANMAADLATDAARAMRADISATGRRAVPMLERVSARAWRDAQALYDLVRLLGLPEGAEVPPELAELGQALTVGPVEEAPSPRVELREFLANPDEVLKRESFAIVPDGFEAAAVAELRPRVEALGWELVGREGPHWLAVRRLGEDANKTAELRAGEADELLATIGTFNQTAAQWLQFAQAAEGEATDYIRKRAEALGWELAEYDGGPWCAFNPETRVYVRHPDGLILLELLKAQSRAAEGRSHE